MALDAAAAQELIKQLNADREFYKDSLKQVLQALSTSGSSSYQQTTQQSHRLTADTLRRNTAAAIEVESVRRTASAFSGDDDDDSDSSDAGASIFATNPLQSEEYTLEGLREHIREYKWTPAGKQVLAGVWDNTRLVEQPFLFPVGSDTSDDRSHFTHYNIHDIEQDGTLSEPITGGRQTSRALQIWERIRHTNTDIDDLKKAVGRLTIIREPSPLLFAALHHTMNKHFDMDEIFGFLVDDDPALMRSHNPFSKDDRHRRSMVWNAEYFTVIGEGCLPMKWQRSDIDGGEKDKDHIPISRCSASVALSFEGKSSGAVKSKDRRLAHKKGDVFDPFSPWRVLAIMCYPDWVSDTDFLDSKRIVNGPEAFLTVLRQELSDAHKRLLKVHRCVEDLIQPPPDFIFSERTRDRFLFEDGTYTLSKRYFWASQTLSIMNQDIEEMIESFQDVFSDSVWLGQDKIIWPGAQDVEASSRNASWRKRMALLRRGIDEEIQRLRTIEHMNEKEIKKIVALREELFSGTSVQESRKSVELAGTTVEQGHNIKILTLVTIFYTPCMFVTGVYGMTNMDPNEDFVHFAIALVAICLPTYLLILHVNTATGLAWWERALSSLSLAIFRTTAKVVEAIIQRRTRWTGKYLDPKTNTSDPLPPGRQRHTRTLSSSSMELGMRSRGAGYYNTGFRSAPLTPSMSRATTEENGHLTSRKTRRPTLPVSPPLSRPATTEKIRSSFGAQERLPQSPGTPLSPTITFELDDSISPGQDMPREARPRTNDGSNSIGEQIRDVEEPFPQLSPSRTLLSRLRSASGARRPQ